MKLPWITGRRALRGLAVLTVAGFVGLVARFWHPVYGFTAFLQLEGDNEYPKISAFSDHPVYVYHQAGGYDGQFYAQIAYDPTLTSAELKTTIDDLAYRGRRILMPAVAWLLSAGQPGLVMQVFSLLNVACWFALAALLWRILAVGDARGFLAWLGLVFSAGAVSSVRLALTDLPALVPLAVAVWAAERSRPRPAVAWLAAAALTRETALVAWPGLWSGSWRSPADVARNLLRGLLVAAPLLAWLAYIRWRIGPNTSGTGNLDWPVTGFVDKWHDSVVALLHPVFPALAWTSLLAVVGLTAQALFIIVRPRPADPWWRVGAAFVLLLAFLGTPVWEGLPGAALRVLLPLNLACNVLALRTRAPLAWLLACNLSIFAGALTLRDVPHDRRELAAVREHGSACILRLGPGWYGREDSSRHVWSWSESGGRLLFDCWPRTGPVRIEATLRLQSPAPGTVTVSQGGQAIWSGAIGRSFTTVRLPAVVAAGGRLELDVATDAKPVREAGGADARLLGLALYDPTLNLSAAPPSRP